MGQSKQVEAAIRGTIATVRRASAFRGAVFGGAIGCAIAGAGVLVLRLGLGIETLPSLWAAAAIPIAIVVGAMLSKTTLTHDEARAWLDDRWQCGGLLMLSDDRWAGSALAVAAPRVLWFDRQLGVKLGVLACFLLGAILVPVSEGTPKTPGFDLQPIVNTLAEEIEVLEEIEAIEPEEAENILKELERLANLARGDDPLTTWEALDHARKELDRLAEQAGEDLADQSSRSSAIEEFASQLEQMLERSPEGLTAEQSETMRRALEELDDDSLPDSVRQALSELAESLSQQDQQQQREAAQRLCESAGQCSGGAMAGLERLGQSGMIDPSRIGQAAGDRQAARQALQDLMNQYSQGECEGGDLLAMIEGMCSGSGGISRGPGAAALTWRDQPSTLEDAGFQPVAVDSNAIDQEQSVFLSDGAALPDGELTGSGSSGGAIDSSRAAESRSAVPVVLPRHREAVRRYFERAENSEEPGE